MPAGPESLTPILRPGLGGVGRRLAGSQALLLPPVAPVNLTDPDRTLLRKSSRSEVRFRRVLLRGANNAKNEWKPVTLAYNCKRLHTMMPGRPPHSTDTGRCMPIGNASAGSPALP